MQKIQDAGNMIGKSEKREGKREVNSKCKSQNAKSKT